MPWDLHGDCPIYLQLAEQLQQSILSGHYKSGDKLPSVRDLASDAAVNPNTMQKALTELERVGLVYSNRTSGRYVTEDFSLIQNLRHQTAYKEIDGFFTRMQSIGYHRDDAMEQLNLYIKERGL